MGRTSDARQRLMDAAYELIWEYSYGAITIDAICERAGVKKGSFYYFFDSKSDLAVAAIDAWWVERHQVLNEIFRTEIAPLERIRRYLDFIAQRQLVSYEADGQILGCPLFTLGAEICMQDKKIWSRVHQFLTTLLEYFSTAIGEAQALGDVPAGNPVQMARKLMCYYEGALTLARIENNPEPVRKLSSTALAVIGARTELVAC